MKNPVESLTYALVTPARNEHQYIHRTLDAVTNQLHKPNRWIIVSDGSTDGTDEIVKKYTWRFDWIKLVCLPEHGDRQFAAKVQAFNAGYELLRNQAYDVIGSLDGDISFEPDYFEFLLERFSENPRLGVAGTPFIEDGSHYDYKFTNIEHVSGACQLFRHQCFKEIGGYIPIEAGGIDWVAVTTARMKGWQTRTFTEKTCQHHRTMGCGAGTPRWTRLFRHGQKDYFLGGHPLWQLFRSAYQMSRPPYLIGGLYLLAGYCWASFRRLKRPISQELMQFHRWEQMKRLRAHLGTYSRKPRNI